MSSADQPGRYRGEGGTMPITQRNLDGLRDATDRMAAGPRHPGQGHHPGARQWRPPYRHTPWLTTINPDGLPTCDASLGWFSSTASGISAPAPATRKSRNLAADPRCRVSVATHPFDLVIEGNAQRVTDADELQRRRLNIQPTGLARSKVDGDGSDRRIQRAFGGSAAVARLTDYARRRCSPSVRPSLLALPDSRCLHDRRRNCHPRIDQAMERGGAAGGPRQRTRRP